MPVPSRLTRAAVLILLLFYGPIRNSTGQEARFSWPDGALAAVSLTFDDARRSQVDVGAPLFKRFEDAKATFYVLPDPVEEHLEGWRRLVAEGHEIGNHTVNHPCTGNFAWARERAIEEYTLEDMYREMSEANRRIGQMLGMQPVSFAYPCGQTYVGRGIDTRSYVPLVAQMFESGRGWMDEGPNDPVFADLAQLTGVELDGKDFDSVLALIEQAKASGAWLVLAGHEIGTDGAQTTRVDVLEQLLEYTANPANGVWIAPVATVRRYVAEQRNQDK